MKITARVEITHRMVIDAENKIRLIIFEWKRCKIYRRRFR